MSSIAIIGDGNVGSALRDGLKQAGLDVPTTGNDPSRVKQLTQNHEVLVLAVPWQAHEKVLKDMGDVDGRTLIDVSNPLGKDGEFADPKPSLAERLQEKAKGANVVKAFNTVFAQNMANGHVQGEPLSLFVAGDDRNAKGQAETIGNKLGFDVVDAGPLENARWLETLGFLNIQLGYSVGLGTDIGFRLVHPKTATSTHETATAR